MSSTRCDCCQGRRTVVGLGGMVVDCSNCKGAGYVRADAPVETVVVVKRKRRTPAEMLADADKGE